MKRTVEHIFNLSPDEVVEAFRWYLTYRELRMANDDKRCDVVMTPENNGATVTFTEEIEDTRGSPGELKWERPERLSGSPRDGRPPDGTYRGISTDG